MATCLTCYHNMTNLNTNNEICNLCHCNAHTTYECIKCNTHMCIACAIEEHKLRINAKQILLKHCDCNNIMNRIDTNKRYYIDDNVCNKCNSIVYMINNNVIYNCNKCDNNLCANCAIKL